jgi:hypothetical protein
MSSGKLKAEEEQSVQISQALSAPSFKEYEDKVLETLPLQQCGLIEKGVCVLCADGLMIGVGYDQTFSKMTDLIRTPSASPCLHPKEMNQDYLSISIKPRLHLHPFLHHWIIGHLQQCIRIYKFVCGYGVYQYNGVLWNS